MATEVPATEDPAKQDHAGHEPAAGTERVAPAQAGPAGDEAPATSLAAEGSAATADTDPGASMRGQVSVVPGIARYHRSGCTLIRFLGADDLELMTREAAEADGCVPCRACQPDKSLADATSA